MMYLENATIKSLSKLINDTRGTPPDIHEGKIGTIHWRYGNCELDVGSNNFDRFGNSTVITVSTHCAVNDGYPIKELLTTVFAAAELVESS